ncbi:hypothetical protein H8959_002225 [Pygathrix nigripes]
MSYQTTQRCAREAEGPLALRGGGDSGNLHCLPPGLVWVGELPVSEGMWENCPLGWVKKEASRTLGPLDFLLQRKRLWLWASEPVRLQP